MGYPSRATIAEEFARRAIQFHSNEDPMKIRLWGLFRWGDVSHRIKTGEIIPNHGFSKENRIIWCKPSQAFYDKWIVPEINKKCLRLLHAEVSGCLDCPAYTFREEDDCNGAEHNCTLGSCGFPCDLDGIVWGNKPVEPGFFASDCRLSKIS